MRWHTIVGMAVLYAAAYFLLPLSAMGEYLLPSRNYAGLIVLPSIVAIVVVSVFGELAVRASRWLPALWVTLFATLLLSAITLIGVKGVMYAAGIDWQDKVPRGPDLLATLRYVKYGSFVLIVSLVWFFRAFRPQLARFLSCLGFALGALALFRLLVLWYGPAASPIASSIAAPSTLAFDGALTARAAATVPSISTASSVASRRVVWVIFDETDYDYVFSNDGQPRPGLTNFGRLAGSSVFAANANSPASATLYSIPALLTDTPLYGVGVRLSGAGSLLLDRGDGGETPFEESTTIFGALRSTGRTASVLGFLHPYCRLFILQKCDSFASPAYGFGGLDAALWANVPYVLSARIRRFSPWEDITDSSLRLLPEYLSRDDALTFIHLNLPHLPAGHADKVLHVAASANPLTEYARNLLLTDRVLGEIMTQLEQESAHREIVLVVSTDHWLRNRWYRANVSETSRRVPLMVWKVGDSKGVFVSKPVSTIHTAAMILEYLDGTLNTQAEIARWWEQQTVHPSFMAPDT